MEKSRIKVCAGIVLFNPEIDQLQENIESLIPQVDIFYLVDNNSMNGLEIIRFLDKMSIRYIYLKNDCNYGIAKALNQVCSQAQEDGYDWILTLDQDSVCSCNCIDKMLSATTDKRVAIVSPIVIARKEGATLSVSDSEENKYTPIQQCITSGSLTSIAIWETLGGFDEWMFIDRVDYEYCKRAVETGYIILKTNNAYLVQRFGSRTKDAFVFGLHTYSFSYSPLRNYYFVRNGIYYIRKYGKSCNWLSVLRGIIVWEAVIMKYEDQRRKKISFALKGICDGLCVRISYPVTPLV